MKYLFTYKLFENISNSDIKKQIYEILSNLDFIDVKIKEGFDGKSKKILQQINLPNIFKISITTKREGDLSKLHSHRIKFSEIKDEVKLLDQIDGFKITSCSIRSGGGGLTTNIDKISDKISGKLIILELKRNPIPITASDIDMDIFLQLKDLKVIVSKIQYDNYTLLKFTLPYGKGNDEIFSQIAESIEQCMSMYKLEFRKIIKLDSGLNKGYNNLQEFEDSDKTNVSYLSCILKG
jgi:hypothetical protein